jgi:hypothetical protein
MAPPIAPAPSTANLIPAASHSDGALAFGVDRLRRSVTRWKRFHSVEPLEKRV